MGLAFDYNSRIVFYLLYLWLWVCNSKAFRYVLFRPCIFLFPFIFLNDVLKRFEEKHATIDGKKLKLSWVPLDEQRKKLTVAYIIRDVATDVLALYIGW